MIKNVSGSLTSLARYACLVFGEIDGALCHGVQVRGAFCTVRLTLSLGVLRHSLSISSAGTKLGEGGALCIFLKQKSVIHHYAQGSSTETL